MSLLAAYYQSIEQENAAKAGLASQQAQLTGVQTNELGANSEAARNLQNAQADATRQGGAKTQAETQQVGANAQSSRSLDASRATQNNVNSQLAPGQVGADVAYKNAQTAGLNQTLGITGFNSSPVSSLPSLGGSVPSAGGGLTFNTPVKQGDEKGGRIVTQAQAAQGKASKPGPTDTVPTMLTPGEAVLNKGAAEHYGSDVIDHMNKMGLMRMGAQSEVAKHMGLPDPHAAPAKGGGKKDAAPAQGFARGTSKVLALAGRHGSASAHKKKRA